MGEMDKKFSKRLFAFLFSLVLTVPAIQMFSKTTHAETTTYTSFNNFIGANQGADTKLIPGKWTRFDLSWGLVEPVRGQYNQSVLDQWKTEILNYKNQGITVVPVLGYNAKWSTAIPGNDKDPILPQYIPDWQNYVNLIVSTFKAAPYNLEYFQVWNEAHPNSGFYNDSLDNYIENIHKPAAGVIHKLNAKVVYGGWPSVGSLNEYVELLDAHNAWSTIDVFDIHYFSTNDMDYLYNAITSRKIANPSIWQTEVGFTSDFTYIPNNYARMYYWALNKWVNPDQFKVMYFAWWSPDDPAAYGYNSCLMSGSNLSYHGRSLITLTSLLNGTNVGSFMNFSNDKSLQYSMDGSQSSIEGYKIGSTNQVVIAVHYNGTAADIKLTFPNTLVNTSTAAMRIDVLGNQSPLGVIDNGNGTMSISVPTNDTNAETKSINLGMRTFYVKVPLTASNAGGSSGYSNEPSATLLSANALLSGLSVDNQGTLTPSFSTSQTNYSVDVPYTVSSLTMFVNKGDPNQTLKVTGATYSTVTDNVYAYNASNLVVGSNPIQIVVSAQNGAQNTYNLTVNRAAPTYSVTYNSNGATSGNAPTDSRTYAPGVTVSVYGNTGNLVKTGYSFAEWNTAADGSGTSYAPGASFTMGAANVTLYAKWYYTPSSGGSGPASSTSDKVTSTDGTLTLPVGKTGEVSLGDAVKIAIPADASTKDLQLTISKVADTQKLITSKDVLTSPVFEILKNFTENFSKDITLTFTFDPKILKDKQKPSVFYYDETKQVWLEVGGEVNGNTITVKVNHFTKYAVFGVGQGTNPAADTNQTISFNDISGHWAEATIKQAVSIGIVSGYPDGMFNPDRTVARAEFAVMLMNALKPQGAGASLKFTDTSQIGSWAQKSVAQAVYTDIISGYEDGSFRPDAEITRPEMAMMIAKALGQSGGAATATGFADDKEIPDWAKGAVAAINKLGIIEGKGANAFAPGDKTTRAEAVTVLLKMLAHKSK